MNQEQDRRADRRHKFYFGDSIQVTIVGETWTLTGECLDLNPVGLSIATKNNIKSLSLQSNEEVIIEISSPAGNSLPLRGHLSHIGEIRRGQDHYSKIGVKIKSPSCDSLEVKRQLGNFSVPLTDYLMPNASCIDPLNPPEIIIFKMMAASPHGATLITSKRNVSLIPGFELDMNFLFPTDGQAGVKARILNTKKDADPNRLQVEILYLQPNLEFNSAMSRHLLIAAEGASLGELRRQGFVLGSNESAYSVSYCQGSREWEDVLALRLKSYQGAGKFLEKKNADEMVDTFDTFSRQIVCKLGSRIVGAIRVVFVNREKLRSEHIQLGIKVPDWLFESDFIEISRACTDNEFRGGDVLTLLFRKGFQICIQSNNRYILANCNNDLWPLYKKIGFQKLGVKFESFGRKDCELIYIDAHRLLHGTVRNQVAWHVFFHPAAKKFLETNPDMNFTDKFVAKAMSKFHNMVQAPLKKYMDKKTFSKFSSTKK